MILDKLVLILNKYGYNCNGKIGIFTNDEKNEFIIDLLKKYRTAEIVSEISDLHENCIILFWFKNNIEYNEQLIKFINNNLNNNKILILIVPFNFNFNHLVKNIIANDIDSISWHGENKMKCYFIVLNYD